MIIDFFNSIFENFSYILFFCSAICALFSASMVVTSKSPIKALLFLILTFFSTAITWMLLNAEFLALSLIFIYVGAILVLFMFVIMLLNLDFNATKNKKTLKKYLPITMFLIFVAIIFVVLAHMISKFNLHENTNQAPLDYNNIKLMGQLLYNNYLLEIEVAGIILLAAMVGAISLVFRRKIFPKTQESNKQVRVRKKDRLRVINIDSKSDKLES